MDRPVTHVLDASAVLCAILLEPGFERVESVAKGAALSAVNYAEVVAKLIERGREPDEAVADLAILDIRVLPLDRDLAEAAARLRPATRAAGLSLGDRCCLALALRHGAVAVTADRAWGRLDPALGIAVDLVR